MQSRPAHPRASWRRLLPWALASVLLVGGALVGVVIVAASLLSGTTITRRSFATEAEAVAFVNGHLPRPLPAGTIVRELTYDRFTDWHLAATVDTGSSEAAREYLAGARALRQRNPDYCGSDGSGPTVDYFLSKWSACGAITPGPEPGMLQVACFTR